MTALLLLAVACISLGVVLGALLLAGHVSTRLARLDEREDQLVQAWRSLLAANRINAAFWRAHEELRREAHNHQDQGTGSRE
jgi:hypothetical protein